MSDPNSNPVSLPPSSYDYDQLKAGLDKAAKGKADDYDGGVSKALEAAAETVHTNNDPRTVPGYKFVDVQNEELGITENIQVFDAELAEEMDAAAGDEATAETTTKARRASKPDTSKE